MKKKNLCFLHDIGGKMTLFVKMKLQCMGQWNWEEKL